MHFLRNTECGLIRIYDGSLERDYSNPQGIE